MKYRLVDLIQPLSENSQLRVKVTKETDVPFDRTIDKVKCSSFCAFKNGRVQEVGATPADCTNCYSREILEGELVSDAGSRYPIVNGIPRMVPDHVRGFLERTRQPFHSSGRCLDSARGTGARTSNFEKTFS
jgi:uncharacterized protein YbaR (Trm112 family)